MRIFISGIGRSFAIFVFLFGIFYTPCQKITEVFWEEVARVNIPDQAIPITSDTSPIPMDDIIKYADNTYQKTGVRQAFLIAIIERESSLGNNYGSCYLSSDPKANPGSGVNRRTGEKVDRVMKPDRDVQPFLRLMKKLGRDPYETPVSCPLKIGWGGAMGAAQIIPSTWIIVSERAAMYLGKDAVDPWVPEDAFMSAGVYLAELANYLRVTIGETERDVACMYYSGKPCPAKNPFISKYGDGVAKGAKKFQNKISGVSVAPKKKYH